MDVFTHKSGSLLWQNLLPSVAAGVLLVAVSALLFFYNVAIPDGAPKRIKSGNWPIVGAVDFFRSRGTFCLQAIRESTTGLYSHTVGMYHVVGLSGPEARTKFIESKELTFTDAYMIMFSSTPPVNFGEKENEKAADSQADFGQFFNKRLTAMLKRENMKKSLDLLCGDTKARLLELAQDPSAMTDPFESVYRIVFQLTMRTVGCTEIAEDGALRERLLGAFERMEDAAGPMGILFPWLPTTGKIQRLYAGSQIYAMFNKIIAARQKEGRREADPVQFMLDQGDKVLRIISFVIGALFAGQINSGVNAAWILVYLATEPEWLRRVRAELEQACDACGTDKTLPLVDQLSTLTLEQWENHFPLIDYCLKDSIRLQSVGTAYRRNSSGHNIAVGRANEIIPPGAIVTYLLDDVHMNPDIYPDPSRWDPGRYLPENAQDKKQPYAFLGWGAGRHPCLGMRFAKLEMSIIVAMFVAAFDFELVDRNGSKRAPPVIDRNETTAVRPSDRPYLRYKLRSQGLKA